MHRRTAAMSLMWGPAVWAAPGALASAAAAAAAPGKQASATKTAARPLPFLERPGWASVFDEAGATGTLALVDERVGAAAGRQGWAHDAARADIRFPPASTFKVPHSLFALDAGVVHDEFQVIAWDGVQRDTAAWNRNQTLRSAMRHSTVWVFQRFARTLGEARERAYLQKIGYGNADPSGGIADFWLDGPLRISATEQVAFLQRLYRNNLPLRVEHQRLVKDLMVIEAGRDWILRAKTGWSGKLGWWIGWVERPEGAVFFALNIDTPHRLADLPLRESIVRRVLRQIDALPLS